MAVERITGSQTDAQPSVVDLTGKEYFLVQRAATGFQLPGLGGKVDGVISDGKAVGLHTSARTGNQLKAVAGANIAIGDKLSSDANAKVRVAAATHWVFGTAMSAAAAGELVTFSMDQEGVMA